MQSRDSSVGIATRYGLDGSGIESRWGEIIHSRPSIPTLGPGTMGTGSFPGVKRPGRGVNSCPLSSAEVKERVVIHLLRLWAFMACSRANFTFTVTYL